MPVLLQDVIFSSFKFFQHRTDDDLIDRLNYFLTPNLLVGLAILVSWKQFGGKPIECMMPVLPDFTFAMEQYAEQYCWAQNTYYMPMKQALVPRDRRKLYEEAHISYYQWVPFVLLIQAFCFTIPSVVWKMLSGQSGIKVNNIVQLAIDAENIKKEHKDHTLKILTSHLENALRFHRRLEKKTIVPHKILRPLNVQYKAFYIAFIYVMVKCLYTLNVVGQFFWLNSFLQTDKYAYYGLGVFSDIMSGMSWEETGAFPRITLCDFQMRIPMSNVVNHTIQCVLTINLFNEKIFVFLYFWYFVLMILTLCSVVYWLLILMLPWPSRWFVTRHMELSELEEFNAIDYAQAVERFVVSYLHADGIFVLRMIMMHTGVIFGTELLLSLWKSYYRIEQQVIERWKAAHHSHAQDAGTKNTTALLDIRRRKKTDSEFQSLLDKERDLVDGGGFVEIMPSAPAEVNDQLPVQKQVSFGKNTNNPPDTSDRRKTDL